MTYDRLVRSLIAMVLLFGAVLIGSFSLVACVLYLLIVGAIILIGESS